MCLASDFWRVGALSARSGRLLTSALLVFFSLGCGASWHSDRGRERLAVGAYDDAIVEFEQAVAATHGDPVSAARYREELQAARIKAAHHYISLGDEARDAWNLAATGRAYDRARKYAPSDPLVVGKLSELLKLRLKIESGLNRGSTTLGTLLLRRDEAANIPRWSELLRLVEGLIVWKKDYPRVVQLREKVLRPASLALLADARRLAALEMFDEASVQLERSLALVPRGTEALAFQAKLRKRGEADRLAKSADEAMAAGKLREAIDKYREALLGDERSHASRTGLREARRQLVVREVAEAEKRLKAGDQAGALAAVQAAREVGTESKREAAALKKLSGRLFGRAAAKAYKRGRRHQNLRRAGAALVAYLTVQDLQGRQRDLPRRIAAMKKIVEGGARYGVSLGQVGVPKGSYPPAGVSLREGMMGRLRDSKLGSRGVRLLEGRRAARKADGWLTLGIERFELRRSERSVMRHKKYLDRVEFTPNPRWEDAQKIQSAALADLNATTDIFRPLQRQVDELETRLEELQGKQVELQRKIAAENARHYAHPQHKNPCPETAPNCSQSWAGKRWSKHTAYYVVQLGKANSEMQEVSPAFSAARERMSTAQAAFDAAEVRAKETPRKLRQEIWLDHDYEVRALQLAVEATVIVAWKDRSSGKELLRSQASYHDLFVDFTTPAVVVREQTLEAPHVAHLPADEDIAPKIVASLLDKLAAAAVEQLGQHGQRFVLKIGAAKSESARIDALARALGTGPALAEAVRKALSKQLLDITGYDWLQGTVDVSRLPK